jgi:hypothetical protein
MVVIQFSLVSHQQVVAAVQRVTAQAVHQLVTLAAQAVVVAQLAAHQQQAQVQLIKVLQVVSVVLL